MHRDRSFTLVELIIVVVIIGILVTFAAPQFRITKERTLDKEAKANIKLIQAAERIYNMELGYHFPLVGSPIDPTNTSQINEYLKLSLPTSGAWNYSTDSTGLAVACRKPNCDRHWNVWINDEEPTCYGVCLPQ